MATENAEKMDILDQLSKKRKKRASIAYACKRGGNIDLTQ